MISKAERTPARRRNGNSSGLGFCREASQDGMLKYLLEDAVDLTHSLSGTLFAIRSPLDVVQVEDWAKSAGEIV